MYDLYFSSNFNHFRFQVLLPSFISIFIILYDSFAEWKKEPLLPILKVIVIFHFAFLSTAIFMDILIIYFGSILLKNICMRIDFSIPFGGWMCAEMMMIAWALPFIQHAHTIPIRPCVWVCVCVFFLCRRKMNYKHSVDAFVVRLNDYCYDYGSKKYVNRRQTGKMNWNERTWNRALDGNGSWRMPWFRCKEYHAPDEGKR